MLSGLDQNLLSQTMLSGWFLLGMRWLIILAAGLYLVFSIVIVRQIEVMKKTLITPFSPVVQVIGMVHLVVVAALGLTFFLIL